MKKTITIKDMPNIYSYYPEPRTIIAEIWNDIFAWHKDGKTYRLTHVPSGYGLLNSVEYKSKQALQEALQAFITPELKEKLLGTDENALNTLNTTERNEFYNLLKTFRAGYQKNK